MSENYKVTGMNPIVLESLQATISEAKARGMIVGLHYGLRTAEEQDRLYALGRTIPNPDGKSKEKPMGNIVTNARAFESWHCYGLAADLVFKDDRGNWTWNKTPEQWEELGKCGEVFGLTWGGRWKMKDYPHFQKTGSLKNVHEAKMLLEKGGIEAVWKLV